MSEECLSCNKMRCSGCEHETVEDARCPYCGGEMTWCDICDTYSSYCCEEYGTCMCS